MEHSISLPLPKVVEFPILNFNFWKFQDSMTVLMSFLVSGTGLEVTKIYDNNLELKEPCAISLLSDL